MYKLELTGTHYEIGKKLGEFFVDQKREFPLKLNKFQTDFGKKSAELLKNYYPEVIEEIKGITDVIKFDDEMFTTWLLSMGCCLRIRENHNVEVRGCTAFGFTHNGKIIYGRDNDLPPYLKKVSKSIYYKPKNKNEFLLNTSSFINGEEGINECGLVAAMTFVLPLKEEIKPGFNSLFLVRFILENCKSVKEGIKALEDLPIASSCNILLMDKSGEMVVAECHPEKINLRFPDENGNGEKYIATVNHFTSEEMTKHDASNGNIYSSRKRYDTAYNSLKEKEIDDPVEFAKNLLSGKYGFMCQYSKRIKFETIWSSIFDITEKKIYIAEGNPMTIKYVERKKTK